MTEVALHIILTLKNNFLKNKIKNITVLHIACKHTDLQVLPTLEIVVKGKHGTCNGFKGVTTVIVKFQLNIKIVVLNIDKSKIEK